MSINNQKGFGLVGVLLAFVAVGLITGTGWYVYNSQKKTNQSLDNANQNLTNLSKQKQSEPAETDETSEWLLYEPPGKEYRIRLADGWVLTHDPGGSELITISGSIDYKAGTKAVVKELQADRGGPFEFNLFVTTDTITKRGDSSQFKTNTGLSGTKYSYTEIQDTEGGHDLSKGDKEFSYFFEKGSTKIGIVHYQCRTCASKLDIVEKVVKTLEIN